MIQTKIFGLILILNFIFKNITLVFTCLGISIYGIGIETIQQTAIWYMNGTLWINMNLLMIALTICLSILYKINKKLGIYSSIGILLFITWNMLNDIIVFNLLGGL